MSAVQGNLLPSHNEKTLQAMKAERTVKRITFDRNEAKLSETLYVSVPKLNEQDVIVPGSLFLVFDIDLLGGHANNFLVQNISRALVDRLVVKFAGNTLQDTVGYDIYKIFEGLFLSVEAHQNMLLEGIQGMTLCKILSNVSDKKTSGVNVENKLTEVYKNKYPIHLDHQILTDHGVFYPQALYNDLIFEVTLAPAAQVVLGSDATKLVYKLTNIQLQYETIHGKELADEATSVCSNGKEFTYDDVMRERVITFAKGSETRLNIRVKPNRKSLRGILLLFIEPFTAGARDSEKYFNPDITKVHVTINSSPNKIYNNGIDGSDMWSEISRFFGTKNKEGGANMNLTKYLADNKFGLLIDLGSMEDKRLHGNGVRLADSRDCVHLEIERSASGSGEVKCHVYTISDAQMNTIQQQYKDVQI